MRDVAKDRNYFKVNRSILDWEWFTDPKTLQVWMYLLAKAAYSQKKWRGIEVDIGQVITCRSKIAADCGISEQNVRTCLKRLKSTNEITIKTTKHYSIITLTNFADYQGIKTDNQPKQNNDGLPESTNNQPTANQQLTNPINKEGKKDKNNTDGTPSIRAREEELLKMRTTLENDTELLTDFSRRHKVNSGCIADMIEEFFFEFTSKGKEAKSYKYICKCFENWLKARLKAPAGDKPTVGGVPSDPESPTNEPPTDPPTIVIPTVEEIEAEIKRRGYTDVDAVMFWSFYDSKGWKVGNQPMKKWKSCLTTWHKRQKDSPQQTQTTNGRSSTLPATTRGRQPDQTETYRWQRDAIDAGLEEEEESRLRKLAALDETGGFSPFEEISSQRVS